MKRVFLPTTCLVSVAAPLFAQDAPLFPNPNRITVGPRVGFGFKAKFANQSQSNPGSIAGVDHNYLDGYVRRDRANNDGTTWNWGYQNSSQVVGDTLEFHSDQRFTVPFEVEGDMDNPGYGAEITYQRALGRFFLRGRWGFEGAFSYTDLDLRDERAAGGFMTHVTDAYTLDGMVVPTAPYSGSFDGPGPLLPTTPVRSTTTEAAFTRTEQRLSGYMFGIRVGPFFEWNFARHFGVTLSGGLIFAPTDLDYEFDETTALASGGTMNARGQSSRNELLYGNYLSGAIRYDFSQHWGVYAGAQFHTLNDLSLETQARTARLEADSTYFAIAGVSFRF